MGASDGFIGATRRWSIMARTARDANLVILGDGYRASELPQYHTDVQNLLTTLRSTPPYDGLWCGINIYIASTSRLPTAARTTQPPVPTPYDPDRLGRHAQHVLPRRRRPPSARRGGHLWRRQVFRLRDLSAAARLQDAHSNVAIPPVCAGASSATPWRFSSRPKRSP